MNVRKLISRLIQPLFYVLRRMTGSSKIVRILKAPAGPVTLYPLAEATPNCTFGGCNFVHGPTHLANTHVGRYTYISENCRFGNVTIGSFCSIAGYVVAGLGKHPTRDFVSTHPAFCSPKNTGFPIAFVDEKIFVDGAPITIGNDVWIGFRAIILDGVNVGDGAIIAAGAVVSHDVEPYSIVGGVPASHIRYRFAQEQISELLSIKWWDKDIVWIREHAQDFANIDHFIRVCASLHDPTNGLVGFTGAIDGR